MEQNQAPIYRGFLLTAHGEDKNNKHILHFFGKADFGPFELIFDKERPLFFIERDSKLQKTGISFERRPLNLKSFRGAEIDACYFQTLSDLQKVKEEGGARTFESDVRVTERFLMERFIKGFLEFSGSFNEENGLRVFKNPQIRAFNSYTSQNLSTLSFDIETSRGNELFSIGIHYEDHQKEVKRVYMVGENQGPMEEKGELFYYPNEKSCYLAFEKDVEILDPDLILGWHVVGFDLAFLERKTKKWGIPLNLGRKRSKVYISERLHGQQFARLRGRVVIDGPNALKSSFFSFESWKLDSVANDVLGLKKDINDTGSEKVKEIERRFNCDKPSLAKYNLLDCILVTKIFKKLELISLMQRRVELSGLLLDRQGVSTAAFDFIMLPELHRKGFVAPNVIDIVRESQSSGGHVLTPEVGLQNHIVVLDFKSLYPSIIRTFNIDPYSRLMAAKASIQTPAGIRFSSQDHILPQFIAELMEQREVAKSENNQALSQAIKILMNSFYGVMGSAGSRFYHADLPAAITGTGQWLLRETVEFFENEGYEVIYGDTDSVFVKLLSKDKPRERGLQMAQKVTEHLGKTLLKHFQVEGHLVIEFEKYYQKMFFPIARTESRGAKKRYVGFNFDETGEAVMSFSGMEYVRSDWTKLAKEVQYSLYEKFFKEENLENFLRETVVGLKNGEYDSKLVYKKRLSKKIDEYTKNQPPHVKAALLALERGIKIEREVRYVQTRRGPVPIELKPQDFDYQHYIDKQIKPIADVILQTIGLSFDNIIMGDQLTLF